MKRKLFKFALLCASVFMLPIGAWADIDFGTEEVVSTTTTWTFNDYETTTQISTCDAGVTKPQTEKLYNRSASSGRGFLFSGIDSQLLTFSDGYTVNVNKIASSSANYNTNNMNAKTAGTSGNESTPYFAFNASVAGTCYAYVKNATASGKTRIFFGVADGTTSVKSTQTQSTDITEIKITSDAAGVFFIGPAAGVQSDIYAVRFVPTSEKKDEWVYIGSTGYATWANLSGCDIESLPSGLKAYSATAGDTGSSIVTLTALDKMRRTQAYILSGDANTNYPLTYGGTSAGTEYNGGDMQRVTEDMENFAPSVTTDKTRYRYILGNDNGTAKFFVPSGSGTLKKGKAYLQTLKNLIPASGSARGIRIVFADDITGVNEVKTQSEKVDNKYYDMMGRRVMNPTKGLYILNGKKIIIK